MSAALSVGASAFGRSEAIAIPNVLVAASEAVASGKEVGGIDGVDNVNSCTRNDVRGYYSDGAYVALPATDKQRQNAAYALSEDDNGAMEGEDAETASGFEKATNSPQIAYYQRIINLFNAQRRALHSAPSVSAVRALSPTQLISLPPSHRRARSEWVHLMQHQHPSPVQLAVMSAGTALQLLRLVTTLLRRRRNVDERLSAWIWGLLGRLDDVGMLSSDEVCVIRDLGKRAIWVMEGFKNSDGSMQEDEVEEVVGSLDDYESAVGSDGAIDEEGEGKEVEDDRVDKAEDRSDGEIEEMIEDGAEKEDSHVHETRKNKFINNISPNQSSKPISPSIECEDEQIKGKENNNHEEVSKDDCSSHENNPVISSPSTPLSSNKIDNNDLSISTSLPKSFEPSSPQHSRHRRNTSSPPSSPTANGASHDSNDLETAKARLLQNITHGPQPSTSDDTAAAGATNAETKTNQNADTDGASHATQEVRAIGTKTLANGKATPLAEDVVVLVPDMNTRATLGMILTIAGEVYGQRDLLEGRERWGVE